MKKQKPQPWTPERIRDLRKRGGFIQREFAELFPVTVTTIANWEQGREEPKAYLRTLLDYIERDIEAGKIGKLQTA